MSRLGKLHLLRLMTFIVLTVLTNQLLAQDSVNSINKMVISSPTAAALGKFGDVPVSYNSGIPNVSIPLYEIKSRKLSLPISLNYHASGLKVQEMASWVGAGWSLDAGGVITRTVVGVPDDRGNGPTSFLKGHYSDYGFENYLFVSAGGLPGATTDGMATDDRNFVAGIKDGEPDMFTFNFAGFSGKFYFNDDRQAILVPEQDFKIETDFSLGYGFNGFVITSNNGTKHFFGKTGNNGSVDPVEMSVPLDHQHGAYFAQKANSSWYLNKIVSHDATDSILFSYVAENYSYYTISMFPISNYVTPQFGAPAIHGYNVTKNLVQGVRISQITFANGSVVFNPSSSPRTDLAAGWPTILSDQANTSSYSLGNIQISNGSGYCKRFIFSYQYFHDNTTQPRGPILTNSAYSNISSDRYKLRLNSVQESSCDGNSSLPPYTFTYFAGLVPRSLSLSTDHWGFYNGALNNLDLLPEHIVKFQSQITVKPGANRESSWPAMRGGSLERITYPTGGYTQFEFEPNSVYVNYNTYNIVLAKSMSVGYDGNSQPLIQPYTFSGNSYELELSNASTHLGSSYNTTAFAIISNSSNTQVLNTGGVPAGQTKKFKIKLPYGQYTVRLERNNPTTGSGASLFIREAVPTPVSENRIVGGLRVKSITTNDGITSINQVKVFDYNAGAQSSGILYSKPHYVKVIKNKMQNLVWPGSNGPNCTALLNGTGSGLAAAVEDQYFKSAVSVRPMETVQGYHIGYNEVKVSQTGNGYSIYRYYGSDYWDNRISDVCSRLVDWDNTCDINIPETPAAPSPFEFKRGTLKYEGHFNQSGQVLRSVWYFPQFEESLMFTPGHISTSANGWGIYTGYSLRSARKVMDSTIETVYHPGMTSSNSVTTVKYYKSKYHNRITQRVSYTSADVRHATNISYAFDFLPSTCTSINDGLSSYLLAIKNDSIKYWDTLFTCTPQVHTNAYTICRYPQTIQFRRNIGLRRIAFLNARQNAANTYNTAHATARSGAGSEYRPVLDMQISYVNNIVEETEFKANLLINSGYTRFDYSTSPAGKVYPLTYQQIDIVPATAGFTKAVVNGSNNGIVKDSRYEVEKTFKFHQGNLVEITDRSGVSSSYIFGHNNALPIVSASNVTHANLLSAYNAVSGNLNNLRGQALLSNAFVQSYTYTPLVGIASEADANNKKVFYEYDLLGRLKTVKDNDGNVLKVYDYQYQATVN